MDDEANKKEDFNDPHSFEKIASSNPTQSVASDRSADSGSNDELTLIGRKIVIIVTGGIAAYKICGLVRDIRRAGGKVRVILTPAGAKFVTPLTFTTLSGNLALVDMFPDSSPTDPIHLSPVEWADLLVVAPASADFIAKMTYGIADDLASTIALAFDKQILIAPAMNSKMWHNPAVQHNILLLRERGIKQVGPETGEMAGVREPSGIGRMSEPEQILARIEELFYHNPQWQGKRVVVTTGPTREPIDPVRFVSNRSSGIMGNAVARAAQMRGADVTLIHSKGVTCSLPQGINLVSVETAKEMAEAVKANFSVCEVLIMTAAVADWTIANPQAQKIKKRSGAPQIEWHETEDILAWAGKNRSKQIIAGFALETNFHLDEAERKLRDKNVHLIALNDPTQNHSAFGGNETKLTLLGKNIAPMELPVLTKLSAAMRLLDVLEGFFA